jgi:hypothetical protein
MFNAPTRWGVLVIATMTLGFGSARQSHANALLNPQYSVDALHVIEGARALMDRARAENVTAKGDALVLSEGALTGSLYVAPVKTRFPFNEAIPSWNGWAPENGGFRVWMRTAGQSPGPWFEAGNWGKVADPATTRIVTLPGGEYDIDTLTLQQATDVAEFRIDLVRETPDTRSPEFRMLALSYSNTLGDRKVWNQFGSKNPPVSRALQELRTTETLNLPFRSQVVPNTKIISRICAASSIGMALGQFGVERPTQELAEMIYDPIADAFGVWNRSIQGVAQHGVRGYITRFRNWDDVRAAVKKGYVVSPSIRFELGDLREPPRTYQKRGTKGHLLVINGFAPHGRIIVNNPASKDWGPNETWLQEDLVTAWFNKGGVAYVFTGRR